jgi:hypothetical protein
MVDSEKYESFNLVFSLIVIGNNPPQLRILNFGMKID